jgi:hypothetical protein
MTTTNVKLFYNGTALDVLMERSVMEAQAKKSLEQCLQVFSLDEIKANCLKDLNELEEDLNRHFEYIDAKIAMKHWGPKSLENYCRWCFGIINLLTLKVLKDDENNGWCELTLPTAVFQSMNHTRFVNKSKLFQNCECCGHEGTLKKCSGCKKVYYCDATCQRSHWKTHKPNCC